MAVRVKVEACLPARPHLQLRAAPHLSQEALVEGGEDLHGAFVHVDAVSWESGGHRERGGHPSRAPAPPRPAPSAPSHSRSPVDSMREAVLTVSPNRQYRGMVRPTTPATHGPAERRTVGGPAGPGRHLVGLSGLSHSQNLHWLPKDTFSSMPSQLPWSPWCEKVASKQVSPLPPPPPRVCLLARKAEPCPH